MVLGVQVELAPTRTRRSSRRMMGLAHIALAMGMMVERTSSAMGTKLVGRTTAQRKMALGTMEPSMMGQRMMEPSKTAQRMIEPMDRMGPQMIATRIEEQQMIAKRIVERQTIATRIVEQQKTAKRIVERRMMVVELG